MQPFTAGRRKPPVDRSSTRLHVLHVIPGIRFTKRSALLLGCGLIFLAWLMNKQGFAEIFTAVTLVGWNLVWLVAFRFLPLALEALGWSALFDKQDRPGIAFLFWARWVAESVNTLLPAAQVGGHVVRSDLLRRRGCNGVVAAASVTVDFTLGLAAQILFTLSGLMLLLTVMRPAQSMGGLSLGIGLGIVLILGFYLAQRNGLFSIAVRVLGLNRLKTPGQDLASMAGALDRSVSRLYRNGKKLWACLVLRTSAWFSRSAETWLFLYFSNQEHGLILALIIESLSGAVRSAAFAVPGAVGIQEGGIFLIGTLLGLPPETALALALVKRAREILVGLPGLLSLGLQGKLAFFSPKQDVLTNRHE